MANERIYTAHNAGTKENPKWELWFAITVADAVKLTDDPDDARTIIDYVNQKIADLIGGAPAAYDTLKEISDYIASHQDIADALNNAIANKADKTVASTSANGLMSKEDKAKLNGVAASANNYVHPNTAGNKHIPSGGASGQILRWNADGNAVWGEDKNTTYNDMSPATADRAGVHGLVPAPAAGANGKYLRGDGTWQSPPNTTYGAASSSANGLMSKEDKAKLDEMPTISMGSDYPASAPNNSIFLLIKSE